MQSKFNVFVANTIPPGHVESQALKPRHDALLSPGKSMLILAFGTKDLRMQPETPPIKFRDANVDIASLKLILSIQESGATVSTQELPIPSRSTEANQELIFILNEHKFASIDMKVVSTQANSIYAIGSTGALGECRPSSVWGERNPLGGRISVPLLSSLGQLIGAFPLEFVIVTSFEHSNARLPRRSEDWSNVKLVGHRGLGMNRPLVDGRGYLQLGENTIQSFVAAGQNGAEFVEFDAQLSRDNVVVLYHDFHLDETGLNVAVNDLFLKQFLGLKPHDAVSAPVKPTLSSSNLRRTKSSGELPNTTTFGNQSVSKEGRWPWKGNHEGTIQDTFTTLKKALKKVPVSIGFNIEIKYPLDFEAEEDRLDVAELNIFVDAILKDVFDCAGERNIIFSSFSAEGARMARLKQSRYPVYFLTMGGTKQTPDSRCNSLFDAVKFAISSNLDGIVTDATPLVKYPDLIKDIKELVKIHGDFKIFTYGGLNNVAGNAKSLQLAGLDGIIVDRVRQVYLEISKK
ncbi:Glycerophosphocholine phosphodiesterase [Phlyctochytrium planicorne]|nr:Glycerophosphocholine phosphodiesterase [Phlyctochytrium planicorne]